MVRLRVMSIAVLSLAAVLVSACGDDSSSNKKGGGDSCVDCVPEAGSAELSVGDPSGDLVEGSTPVTLPLKLQRAPTADVIVSVTSLNPTLVTVEPASLTFSAESWSASQVITLTPGDDSEVTGDREIEIEFTMASEDPGFSNRPVNSLRLTLLEDDELPSFDVTAEGGEFALREDGQLVLDVMLSAQPTGEVLVPVDVDDATEAEVDVERLSFDTLNWNIAQQVVLTGIDDEDADGDQAINLLLGPTNSTDDLFNQLPPYRVAITSVDGVCGNGVKDGAEACEPSGESTTCAYGEETCTYCTSSCEEAPGTPSGYCGDGTVQAGDGEECDEPMELCPYGEMSCETCSAQCKRVPGRLIGYCGDGKIQTGEGEACDPGVSPCCGSDCQQDTASCAPECLIISEYYDGSLDDKAVELYNCGTTSVPLGGIELCLIQNAAVTCTHGHSLSGTLAAGDTLTVCNSGMSHPQASRCDVMESSVTQFNGDDRLLLYVDLDSDRYYDPGGDVVVDAFGDWQAHDASQPWKDLLLRRCNFQPYVGSTIFILSSYYKSISGVSYASEMDGFGVAPIETCP